MQLVINTFGASLRKQGDRFIVRAGEKELAVSAHKVQSILITTGVHFSSDVVQLAIAHNVDIVFLDVTGQPYGRIWQGRLGSTTTIRRRQLEVADTAEGLGFVREWVEAKVRNEQEFLQELEHRRSGQERLFRPAIDGLEVCLSKLRGLSGTLDEQRGSIMGLEGSAGRAYFACLSDLMPQGYRFEGRSRHPAADGFNAMLNYSFGILYSIVEKACIIAGLDPFVGFLHTDNYAKKSLVYDLIEPFRILGERATVLLFTGRRVLAEWFEPVPGGIALSKEGRAAFVPLFNERLDKRVRYPVQGQLRKSRNIKQRDVIQFEAHGLANALLSKRDMPKIVETRVLWDDANAARENKPELDEEETDASALEGCPNEKEPPC
ncbi:MAG: CRISPR-associated endonuclease Cas1 [Gemmataceae bacterium]